MVALARRGQAAVLAIHQHHAQPVFQRAQVAADDGVAHPSAAAVRRTPPWRPNASNARKAAKGGKWGRSGMAMVTLGHRLGSISGLLVASHRCEKGTTLSHARVRPMADNASLLARREQAVPRGVASSTAVFADRAENAELWDVEGRRYVDFAGGIAVLNTGHRHPKVIAAVQAQLDRFTHTAFQVSPMKAISRWPKN
jgi:hypothetical protein